MSEQNANFCPINCPFLASRSFLPKTMPFYCEKYATFLGMDSGKKVLRCSACTGKKQDVVQVGLALLEAQMLPQGLINQMKKVFMMMTPIAQKNFTSILEQMGCQLGGENEELTPFSLMRMAQHAKLNAKRRMEAPEVQEFIKLLEVVGGDSPLDGKTKNILINLFQVIDGSERSMLLSLMENPKTLAAFLKALGKTPHDKDLLRNFRALLYDAYQTYTTSQTNQSALLLQQMQQNQMARTIQQMTKARAAKMRGYQNGRERN